MWLYTETTFLPFDIVENLPRVRTPVRKGTVSQRSQGEDKLNHDDAAENDSHIKQSQVIKIGKSIDVVHGANPAMLCYGGLDYDTSTTHIVGHTSPNDWGVHMSNETLPIRNPFITR